MPHPWWQFWRIGDFLLMLVVVVLFVRFMRRSDARASSEEPPPSEEDGSAMHDTEATARREPEGGADGDPDA